MGSTRKRKLGDEPNSQHLQSAKKSPKKKKAIRYPCADHRCAKSFTRKKGMESHLRDVHKDKYCFACNKHFDKVSKGYHLLQVHQGVSESGTFCCSRCPEKKFFKKEQDFMDHVRWKHNGCAACGIFFNYHYSCSEHIYNAHNVCRRCGERFCGPESLAFHREHPGKVRCWSGRLSLPARPLRPVIATASATEPGQQGTTDLAADLPELKCLCCNDYRPRSWQDLEQHYKTGHNRRYGGHPSLCGVYQEQFSTKHMYKLHFETSPIHFISVVCENEQNLSILAWRDGIDPRDYESQEALDEHRMDHHVRCESCDIWLFDQKSLNEHRERRHWSIICKTCDNAFPNKGSLRRHRGSQKHKGKFECVGCTSKFELYSSMFSHLESGNCYSNITERDLSLHIKNIYREPTQDDALHLNYQCPYLGCKKKFPRMFLLFRHLEDRICSLRGWQDRTALNERLLEPLENAILAPLRCTKCNEYFGVEGRDDHIRDEHDSIFCFICNQHFSSREELRFHIQCYIQDSRAPAYKDRMCRLCTEGPRIYRGEKKFYDHMWTAHNSCAVCALDFDTKQDLLEHDKKVHFKCHVCSDLSDDASALKRHLYENHLKFSKIEVSTWRGPKLAVADELAEFNSDAGPLTPEGSLEEMMMPVGRQPLIRGFFR